MVERGSAKPSEPLERGLIRGAIGLEKTHQIDLKFATIQIWWRVAMEIVPVGDDGRKPGLTGPPSLSTPSRTVVEPVRERRLRQRISTIQSNKVPAAPLHLLGNRRPNRVITIEHRNVAWISIRESLDNLRHKFFRDELGLIFQAEWSFVDHDRAGFSLARAVVAALPQGRFRC